MPTVTERALVPRPADLPELVPPEAVREVRHLDDDGRTTLVYYDDAGSPILTVEGVVPEPEVEA